jgi:hypothetical protein
MLLSQHCFQEGAEVFCSDTFTVVVSGCGNEGDGAGRQGLRIGREFEL